jgi:hypothetical protein
MARGRPKCSKDKQPRTVSTTQKAKQNNGGHGDVLVETENGTTHSVSMSNDSKVCFHSYQYMRM